MLSKEAIPCFVAGRSVITERTITVREKYSGALLAQVSAADDALIDQAVKQACAAEERCAKMHAHERHEILMHCVRRLTDEAEALAHILTREVGKTIREARTEVERTISTFRLSAGESLRLGGEVIPLDVTARGNNTHGMWKRVPVGACSFISPFNFPLNLTAHKIAPAIACGCPFLLKPASLTPLSVLRLGGILAETDLPQGSWSILPCNRSDAERFTTDERLKLLSFTGSPEVGWALKAAAGRKTVILELGGNAALLVDETWDDLQDAAQRIVAGAFAQAGQSCISVQRIFLHESLYDDMRARLIERTKALICGDPADERTDVGPVISESEARRIESWIESAVQQGARLLCGGVRQGALIEPALLEGVPCDADLSAKEVFAPVAIIERFSNFEEALQRINASDYGLQAGILTRDITRAMQAWDVLDVGGVIIGDVPSFRADNMPYGGVKASGIGREGVRFAIEHLTEPRMLVIRSR